MAPTSDSLPPIINRQDAVERLGGDEEMLTEFLGMLLEQAQTMLPEIAQAIEANDASGVEQAGHSLKGAAASLGAERMRHAAYAIEIIGRSGNLEQAGQALGYLQEQVTLLRQALEG